MQRCYSRNLPRLRECLRQGGPGGSPDLAKCALELHEYKLRASHLWWPVCLLQDQARVLEVLRHARHRAPVKSRDGGAAMAGGRIAGPTLAEVLRQVLPVSRFPKRASNSHLTSASSSVRPDPWH